MLRLQLSATILCLCGATNALGQVDISATTQPAATTLIQSTRIDSFTNVTQERGILVALSEPCRFEWSNNISV